MSRRIQLLKVWTPVLVYMAVIFYSSSRARPDVVRWAPDYALHFGAYFLLSLLAARAFARSLPTVTSSCACGVALALAYGVSDEWHQSFVPGRDPSAWDVLADALGALSAAGAYALRLRGNENP